MEEAIIFEVRAFVDSIINNTKPPIDIFDALNMTVPGLVLEESINNDGIPLSVPDFRKIKSFPGDLPKILRKSPIVSVGEFQATTIIPSHRPS